MNVNIPLDLIQANPWQTRKEIDEKDEAIQELAVDIAAHGLLQTPMGRLSKDGMRLDLIRTTEITTQFDIAHALETTGAIVQLAFGHRRLAAFWENLREARSSSEIDDWSSMPVEIQVLSDERLADLAWAENEKRQEHTPLDRALAIQKRMEDFGWSQTEIADHLGISRPVVSNSLRLLKLPEEITEALGKGELSERQAMALAGLYDLPESMLKSAEEVFYSDEKPTKIVERALAGASSDEIRRLVNNLALRFGKSLSQQGIWDLDLEFQIENVRSVTCRDCEWRLKERNICTDTLCFNTKETHIKSEYLELASKAVGIPALEPGVGLGYVTMFDYASEYETIRQSGCENLRLAYVQTTRNSRKDSLAELGFPNAIVVCSKRSGSCSCLKGIDYAKEQERARSRTVPTAGGNGSEPVYEEPAEEIHAPSSDELRELARQQRAERRELGQTSKQIQEQVGKLIARELRLENVDAWRLLMCEETYQFNLENTKEYDFMGMTDAVGLYAASRMFPYDPKSAAEIVERINDKLRRYGMPGIVLLDDGTVEFGEKEVEGMPVF